MDAIKQLILQSVPAHPHDLITFIAEKTGGTRPGVHKHVRALIEDGAIHNISNKKTRPHYTLEPKPTEKGISKGVPKSSPDFPGFLELEKSYLIPIESPIFEDEIWRKYFADELKGLDSNIFQICQFGFTEMFNNVIDHSEATQATIILRKGLEVEIQIFDNGVGIFQKLRSFLKLSDTREAILHLSKGKLTTDPQNHTGQGIFFTSRAFDQFSISSNNLSFVRTGDEDWFLEEDPDTRRGTLVSLKINPQSKRKLEDVFRRYTSGDDMDFSKTHALVQLSKHKDEHFISRSQAKRLLLNLDKFLFITLDFKGVKSVGQGFVDEVFRVFKNYHPNIQIDYKNANPNIEFMIKRSID